MHDKSILDIFSVDARQDTRDGSRAQIPTENKWHARGSTALVLLHILSALFDQVCSLSVLDVITFFVILKMSVTDYDSLVRRLMLQDAKLGGEIWTGCILVSCRAFNPLLDLGQVNLFRIDEVPVIILVGNRDGVRFLSILCGFTPATIDNIETKSFELRIIEVIDMIDPLQAQETGLAVPDLLDNARCPIIESEVLRTHEVVFVRLGAGVGQEIVAHYVDAGLVNFAGTQRCACSFPFKLVAIDVVRRYHFSLNGRVVLCRDIACTHGSHRNL